MRPPRIHDVPIHPVLVHFPVAGWTAATLLACLALLDGNAGPAGVLARWCNIAGLLTGMAAMAAGFLELQALPESPTIRTAVVRHLMLAAGSWCSYLVMLFMQLRDLPVGAAVAGGIAFCLLVAAGHAGARLVYHHRLPVALPRSR